MYYFHQLHYIVQQHFHFCTLAWSSSVICHQLLSRNQRNRLLFPSNFAFMTWTSVFWNWSNLNYISVRFSTKLLKQKYRSSKYSAQYHSFACQLLNLNQLSMSLYGWRYVDLWPRAEALWECHVQVLKGILCGVWVIRLYRQTGFVQHP